MNDKNLFKMNEIYPIILDIQTECQTYMFSQDRAISGLILTSQMRQNQSETFFDILASLFHLVRSMAKNQEGN